MNGNRVAGKPLDYATQMWIQWNVLWAAFWLFVVVMSFYGLMIASVNDAETIIFDDAFGIFATYVLWVCVGNIKKQP